MLNVYLLQGMMSVADRGKPLVDVRIKYHWAAGVFRICTCGPVGKERAMQRRVQGFDSLRKHQWLFHVSINIDDYRSIACYRKCPSIEDYR